MGNLNSIGFTPCLTVHFVAASSVGLFLGQLDNSDDQQYHHQGADYRPNQHSSARPSTHPSVMVIHHKEPLVNGCLSLVLFASTNDVRANSFRYSRWPVRAGVTRNSHQTFHRASAPRMRTETFAGSGHCKSRMSFHRVQRGARRLRPRSCRRWGLWC